ncbi:MAG: hypothetical protein WAM28_00790 [Chlamydiales bacterium]
MISNELSQNCVSISGTETQNPTTTLYQNRPTQILINTAALAVLALGGLGIAAFASGVAVATPLFASTIGATVVGSSILLRSSYKAVNAYRERARASNFATPLIKESLEDARNKSEVSYTGVELTDESQIDSRSVFVLSNAIDLTEQMPADSSGETDKSQEAATNNIELDGKSHGAYAGYYVTAKKLAFYAIPVLGVVAALAATYYYFGGNANNTDLSGPDVCPNDLFHNLKEVCPSNFEVSNGNGVSLVEDGLNSIRFKNETGSLDVNSDLCDQDVCLSNFKVSNEDALLHNKDRNIRPFISLTGQDVDDKQVNADNGGGTEVNIPLSDKGSRSWSVITTLNKMGVMVSSLREILGGSAGLIVLAKYGVPEILRFLNAQVH